mgnify:CR=1 FL=1|jgi:nucleotide-binding universal stress UspA family protein
MKILVPISRIDSDSFALNTAALIAKHLNAQIDVLRIIDAPVDAVLDRQGSIAADSDFDVRHYDRLAQEAKDEIVKWAEKNCERCQAIVKTGLQVESILSALDEGDYDLVVVAGQLSSGIKELMQGTLAEKIALHTTVPVLTVKSQIHKIESIALANNFRKANVPIEDVLRLQKVFGATLHLVRVNSHKKYMSEDEVQENMDQFISVRGLKNVEKHSIEGLSIDAALSEFCDSNEIDILAIGSKQRSKLTSIMQGCPSRDVINHLSTPVFTFNYKQK